MTAMSDAPTPRPLPFHQDTAGRRLLELVATKWSALVICLLSVHGPLRYSQIERSIEGISQRMLTRTLRDLERAGLVRRTVEPSVPPKVEYALTRLGRSLSRPLHALVVWADRHAARLVPIEQSVARRR